MFLPFLQRLGKQPSELKSFSLIPPEHKIHVLDGLPRCPLDKVIYGSNYYGSSRTLVCIHADVAEIGAPHVPYIRETSRRKDPYKRFIPKKLLIHAVKLGRIHRWI